MQPGKTVFVCKALIGVLCSGTEVNGFKKRFWKFAKAICFEVFNEHAYFYKQPLCIFTFAQQLIFTPPTFILHHLFAKSIIVICKISLYSSFPPLKFLFHISHLTYIDEISSKMFHNFSTLLTQIFHLNFCTAIQ